MGAKALTVPVRYTRAEIDASGQALIDNLARSAGETVQYLLSQQPQDWFLAGGQVVIDVAPVPTNTEDGKAAIADLFNAKARWVERWSR